MRTRDMSLNVSMSSIGCRNEWLLIARLMVSRRIRVMDTVLNIDTLKWIIWVAQPQNHSWIGYREKFDKDKIVIQRWIKIPWHPHHTLYFCELRDWSFISWHPHHTLYFCELRDWSFISWHPHHTLYFCELRDWSFISWHPHHTLYFCELRDWSFISWHPHPTICLLR